MLIVVPALRCTWPLYRTTPRCFTADPPFSTLPSSSSHHDHHQPLSGREAPRARRTSSWSRACATSSVDGDARAAAAHGVHHQHHQQHHHHQQQQKQAAATSRRAAVSNWADAGHCKVCCQVVRPNNKFPGCFLPATNSPVLNRCLESNGKRNKTPRRN